MLTCGVCAVTGIIGAADGLSDDDVACECVSVMSCVRGHSDAAEVELPNSGGDDVA